MSFEDKRFQESCKQYFLLTVEIKDYNVVIYEKKKFDQPVKNNLRTYDKIKKTAIGQGDDYTNGCLLDYPFLKKYKLTAMNLSKQQKLDAESKAIKPINFTGNLDEDNTSPGNTNKFFVIEEAKETVLHFSKGTVTVLWFYFVLIWN